MLKHIALIKFKAEASAQDHAQLLHKLFHLKNIIPEIQNCYGGMDCTDLGLNHGYSHAFVVEFLNAAGLTVYLQHPAQDSLTPMLQRCVQDLLILTLTVSAQELAPRPAVE